MKKFIIIVLLLLVCLVGLKYLWEKELVPMESKMAMDCWDEWKEATGQDLFADANTKKETGDAIGIRYTIPRWYYKRLIFDNHSDVAFGKEFTVHAWLMPWLTDMEDVEMEFGITDGLTVKQGEEYWKGDIGRCEVKEWSLSVAWDKPIESLQRIEWLFAYDFPKKELLQYIQKDPDEKYRNPPLADELVDLIKAHPSDRADSMTLYLN